MQQLAKVDISSITVGKSVVNTKPVVRNFVVLPPYYNIDV